MAPTPYDAGTQGAFRHVTVLRDEVVSALAPRPGGVYLDVTLGGGGHAEAILRAAGEDALLIGIDRDPLAREAASRRLAPFGDRARVHAARMSEARRVLEREGVRAVDGLVADLGVSSPQIDDPSRGMSFKGEGPLDMRMDPTQGPTAADLLRTLSERELADVIYQYGEERASRPIARRIKEAIQRGEMQNAGDLARAVYRVLGPPRPGRRIDPATRTFQALRIAVNDELAELDALLDALPELLADGGVAALISFHSLEDRRVKRAFRATPELEVMTKKPIEASAQEVRANPRARSAKLRIARRRARADAGAEQEGTR